MKQLPQITFSFQKKITLKDRIRLKQFLTTLFKENNQALDMLHYVFCSDEEILDINRQYLDHDYYTDIITFDLREKPSEAMVADIFISVDTVQSNASLLNIPVAKELHRVIFHGALHLCGYNDKTEKEQALMREKEDECLQKYGFR
ncbi:rRNA maturation RNase YbeY [Niabella sp.]|uniref:rRNA maturation RNase YbeY n=1 Tax=Niabella sp. TaxID=1962976 RepID=UPI00262BA56E|nr:rRNA maturation RNase YbeY [Niabella sp.]